jgi:hypothetical protein
VRALPIVLWALAGLGLWHLPAPEAAPAARTQDWHARLARHWAPVIFQAVDAGDSNPLGRYDFIAAVDFDGDLAGGNNWENADDTRRSGFPLKPYVYYAVLETETHYYLTYSLFHPRDWAQSAAVLTHENDLESATLVVLKDGGFGTLRIVGTVCHLNNYCFVASPGISVKTWALDAAGGDIVVRHYDGRPCLFVESQGHGIGGILRALVARPGGPYAFTNGHYAFNGDAGVVYRCAEDPAYLPDGEPAAVDVGAPGDAACYYQLVPLLDSLWPLRSGVGPGMMFDGVFTYISPLGCSVAALPLYLAADGQPAGANPPWARNAYSDGLAAGVWFLDPAYAFQRYARTWDDPGLPGYDRYVRNDYAPVDIAVEVALPADDCPMITGLPVTIRWHITAEPADVADQSCLFLSRNEGRTWTRLPVPIDLPSGMATWEASAPASDRCVIALRVPLACDAAIQAAGYSPVFSIIEAGELEWIEFCKATPTLPSTGGCFRGIYDGARDRLVILSSGAYGLSGLSTSTASEVWAFGFADLAWERLDDGASEAPSAHGWPVLAYDRGHDRLVAYGGTGTTSGGAGDVWLFSLAEQTWSRVATSGGDVRSGAVGVYDSALNRLVIFGGSDGSGDRNDVRAVTLPDGLERGSDGRAFVPEAEWETLDSGSGIAPAPRCHAFGAYDPVGRRVLVQGGLGIPEGGQDRVGLADIWAFSLDARQWTLLHEGSRSADEPSGRWRHTGVLESAGPRLVIYGGLDGQVAFSDAWAFDLETLRWALLNDGLGAASPGPRAGAAAGLRSRGGQMVLCGGMGIDEPSAHLDVWSMALGPGEPVVSGRDIAPDTLPVVAPTVWPNPSRAEVNVSFTLRRQGKVRVTVYDVSGRLVRVLRDSALRAGVHAVPWDGRDAVGRNVAEGVYFCRIAAEGFTVTRSAVILR